MLVMNKNDVKTNEKTSAMVGRRCIMCVYVGGGDRRATGEGDGFLLCVKRAVKN